MTSLFKCLKKGIKECDCFGTFITFRINKDNELKSVFGGCSTLMYSLIAIIYISYMSYRFIARKNINFINAYRIVDSEPFINLTDIGFNFAFGLETSESEIPYVENDIPFFNYSVFLVEWIGDQGITKSVIPTKKCEENDFHNLVDKSFKKSNLDKLICPDWGGINYTLEGTYMDYYYKYIIIQIGLTEYALNNLDLTKQLFIQNNFEMALFFLDNAMEYDNRTNPMPMFLNHIFRAMDFNYQKTTDILISPVEFYNDENIIVDNPSVKKGLTIDWKIDSFRNSDRSVKRESLVSQIILKTSTKVVELRRSYEKLPIFVADLTGILEDLLIFLLLTVNVVERIAIDRKLISKMLKFRGSKYYDIDYLVKTFNKEKINTNLMKIINKPNLDIVKTPKGGLKSGRKSVMTLLENRSFDIKKTRTVNFLENQGKKNNFLNNYSPERTTYMRKTFEFPKHEIQSEINIEVQPTERDGINMLNHSTKKSYMNSYMSIHSISSLDDVTQDNKRNIIIDDLNSSHIINKNNNSSNNNSNNNSTNEKKTNENEYKKNVNDFANLRAGICETIFIKLFFWISKGMKRRKSIILKGEERVHYYLDVFNYIKKMQEIDLLTYCIFDQDQFKLFEYLSKPPVKFDGQDFNVYNEFLNRQVSYKSIDKDEIENLYKAYNNIRKKEDLLFEDIKLLRLVNAEVKFYG